MAEKQELALLQKDITDTVSMKIAELQKEGLVVPPNYSAPNALKSAFFALTNSASGNLLTKCTKESIANSLLDMTIQGLSPAKTQCYFIPYGDQLKMTRSYFGTQAVMKRLSNVDDIYANVIYKGDEFVYENRKGKDYLISHKTSLENHDNEIIGAYAIVERADSDIPMTVMSRKEIESAWSQSKTGGAVHKKFPQEMAKRTVINRAAKNYINTSDDADILVETINKTTENEYEDERIDKKSAMDVEVEVEVVANANTVEFEVNDNSKPIEEKVKEKKTIEKDKVVEECQEPLSEPKQEGWNL